MLSRHFYFVRAPSSLELMASIECRASNPRRIAKRDQRDAKASRANSLNAPFVFMLL